MTDEELSAAIREVRERVRNRTDAQLPLPDLMPLVHARDAAEAKVAAIGTVNPRRPGAVSSIIQSAKKLVARALDWHVREQVEFNRASLSATHAAIEVLNETKQALYVLSSQMQTFALQVRDHRNDHEIYTLRTAAELQAAFRARIADVQERLTDARKEHEKLIHSELRTIRLRSSSSPVTAQFPAVPAAVPITIDWLHFANRFRGPEETVRAHQRRYLPKFQGATHILDLGCGRGEFLEAARDAGLEAWGVDNYPDFVTLCRQKGLKAIEGDAFAYLESLPDETLGGAFCSHFVEHLEPTQLPYLIHLLGKKLKPEAPTVFETPNAESVSALTRYFFLDPTHVRPVPSALLRFYLEEGGFGAIESETIPPEDLDCAVYARKL